MVGELRCMKCKGYKVDPIHDYRSGNPERRAAAHKFQDPTDPLNWTSTTSRRASRWGLWAFLAFAAGVSAAAWWFLGRA